MHVIDREPELSKDQPFVNESSDWFNKMVASIRSDEVQIAAGIADPGKTEFYKSAMSGNIDEMVQSANTQFSRIYISEMLFAYLNEITKRNIKPLAIHVYHTINTLHVWAIISDDDFHTEKSLFLAEAFVNSKYSKFGYTIDTIILEDSDKYTVPNHYIKFI